MKMSISRKIIFLIFSLVPLSTLALPTPDLGRFVDNDTTTLDTHTGLEWLDVTGTNGLAYSTVAAKLLPGNELADYRFATSSEISDVFDAFNLPDLRVAYVMPEALRFVELFGSTDSWAPPTGDYYHYTKGWVESSELLDNEIPSAQYFAMGAGEFWKGSPYTEVHRNHPGDPDWPLTGVGSFLVKKAPGNHHAVPEIDGAAAPIALSLLLFTALVRWERRKRA